MVSTGLPLSPGNYDPLSFSAPAAQPSAVQSPSLLDQVNTGLQQATQNFVPLSIPGAGNANIGQPVIQSLPSDINSYVKKYTTNLPALQSAVAAGTITPEAVNAVQAYDASRVTKGQAPLNAKQTQGALQTVSTGQQATPEPSHSAWDVFGNAHRDLTTLVNSIPHLVDPRTYLNELGKTYQIPEDIAKAPNPVQGFFQAPDIRLIPGAYTLGNLAGGRAGLETALQHPLFSALDAMAINHAGGSLLAGSDEIDAAKAAGEHVPGALGNVLQSTGAQDTIDSLKSQFRTAALQTKGGQWLDTNLSDRAQALSMLGNRAAAQARDMMNPALESGTHLIDPEQAATQLTRGVLGYAKNYAETIAPDRMEYLSRQFGLDPEKIPDLTDPERAFLTDTRQYTDSFANYHVANSELAQRVVNGTMEIYRPSEAATLDKAWAARDRYEAMTMVRQAVRNPDLLTPEHLPILADKVNGMLANDDVPGLLKARLARGYAYAVRQIDGTLPDGYAKAVAAKDWSGVQSMLESHEPTFDLPQTRKEATLTKTWVDLSRQYTPSRMNSAFKIAGKVEDEVLPARWRDLSDQLLKGKVTDKLAAYGSSNNIDVQDLLDQAYREDYKRIADSGFITHDDMQTFKKEAAVTIGEIRRQTGQDPIYQHRVEEQQVPAIQYGGNPVQGTLSGTVKTPSQLRETPDFPQPYIHNVTVGLSHEAQQVANQLAQTYFYKQLLRTAPEEGETVAPFARTYADLSKQFEGSLRARQSINPQISDLGVIEREINRGYQKFPISRLPEEVKIANGLTDEMGENHPYLPKGLYRVVEQMNQPSYIPILDPIMKVFRTALLPLSPRFLLYHAIGGMIQLAGQTDPFGVWKFLGEARDMIAQYHGGGSDTEALAQAQEGETPKTGKQFPETLRPVFGHIMAPELEWDAQAGGTIRRLFGDGTIADAADAIHDKFGNVVQKSFALTSFFQDTYRAMGYLYGYDKALTAGMDEAQAAAAGETLARKALMTWDDMTPGMRTGMRAIFPFYGFARHILQYAAQYPIDHPFRTAVIASIARNEYQDLGTGLPSTMLNMLFLGHPDKHGHVESIMGGALNPFRDVANMTTLAGWLASTNPIISGVLQSAGLNVANGGPDLYPNLQYDSDTGRLAAQSTNPLLNILTQTVPQSQLLLGMLNKSSEYQTLMRTDPSSAMRLIASQAGIPLVVEDQNVGQKQIQGEVTRETSAATAYDTALKTGNFGPAMQWPTVAPVLRQVTALKNSGALSQFMPGGANDTAKLQQIAQMIGSVG